jgi:hypothetical protein
LDTERERFFKDNSSIVLGLENPVLSEGPDDLETVFIKFDGDVVLLVDV